MPPIVVTLALCTGKGREHSSFPAGGQAMADQIKGADAREIEADEDEANRDRPLLTRKRISSSEPPALTLPRKTSVSMLVSLMDSGEPLCATWPLSST